MTAPTLDIDSVRAFVRVADLGSFTRAAEAAQTTQSAVSLKLKRLEDRLGCRLVERTPRHVQLSSRGLDFLDHARGLLEAHDRAYAALSGSRQRLALGISDHVAGPELPDLIGRMNAQDQQVTIEIRIGSSGDLLQSYDHRELDAVIVRFDAGRGDGTMIAEEKFGWFASRSFQHQAGTAVPIATMPDPCGVRSLACHLLDDAGIAWNEVFIGGGIAAVSAAVMANLGVAALAPRILPLGAVDVGRKLGLPELPHLPVMLHSRVTDEARRNVLLALSAAYRGAVRG